MRAAILGCGALGTILGAKASLAGHDCTMIDANKEHVDALNKYGATITGQLDHKNVPVKAITPDQMEGKYDLVFLLTKQTANKVAVPNLLNYLHEKSIVCTLQNGVPEESVDEMVGGNRTMGGCIMWGGEQWEPGKVVCTTAGELMTIDIGSISGEITEDVRKVEEWLQCQGKVTVSENLMGVRWMKLWVNAGMSGMSASLNCTYGDICQNDEAVRCAAHIADEVVRVSRAKGIKMEGVIKGYNADDLTFDTKEGLEHTIACIRKVHMLQPAQTASMLQDMKKGRPCEIDFIDGEVTKNGAKYGVPTPYADTVVRIVKEFEAGKRPMPTMDNLKEFPQETL
ncbi:MAG: 2-dehydropantoate 2-reductase [Firmicutes bacterium]|nr:2-dehydropantoate 2-reductase [Bacillota bacterium]